MVLHEGDRGGELWSSAEDQRAGDAQLLDAAGLGGGAQVPVEDQRLPELEHDDAEGRQAGQHRGRRGAPMGSDDRELGEDEQGREQQQPEGRAEVVERRDDGEHGEDRELVPTAEVRRDRERDDGDGQGVAELPGVGGEQRGVRAEAQGEADPEPQGRTFRPQHLPAPDEQADAGDRPHERDRRGQDGRRVDLVVAGVGEAQPEPGGRGGGAHGEERDAAALPAHRPPPDREEDGGDHEADLQVLGEGPAGPQRDECHGRQGPDPGAGVARGSEGAVGRAVEGPERCRRGGAGSSTPDGRRRRRAGRGLRHA